MSTRQDPMRRFPFALLLAEEHLRAAVIALRDAGDMTERAARGNADPDEACRYGRLRGQVEMHVAIVAGWAPEIAESRADPSQATGMGVLLEFVGNCKPEPPSEREIQEHFDHVPLREFLAHMQCARDLGYIEGGEALKLTDFGRRRLQQRREGM